AEDNYFEELMLQSMVIGYVDVKDVDEWVGLITDFIPKINNWSICDTFCVSLKQTQLYKKEVWELIKNYFHSEKEYEVRFSIVMVIFYFIECPYLEEIYKKIDSIKHDGYYVKMAIAWAISIAYIKFPRNTLSYLKNNNLDLFTYNMALQKIIESRQVESIKKDQIRTMKRSSRIN
ncbi:DNA alkylation repair protein, partial [Shouchella miscanthi]|nr:DNA alkylation repair protein [Shouchella miscanthi]